MAKKVTLICKRVYYYSPTDKELFFEWISRIPSIKSFEGVHDELHLFVENSEIPDQDLREIISMFYRYKIDMKQLQIFLNPKNKSWFHGTGRGYWYKKVFGAKRNRDE